MPAIPAIIGGGASLISGLLGSRAANSAARTQSDAAAVAAAEARRTGQTAATDVTQAGQTASTRVTDAGTLASLNVTNAGQTAATGVTDAARTSSEGVRLSAEQANELLRGVYGENIASLQPYREGGTAAQTRLAAGTAAGGEFDGSFKAEDLEMDPGYQFRLAEAQKALERSAAKGGSLGSGGTLKSLARYSQGLASQEYAAAFDRHRTGKNDSFSQLSSIANSGLRATETGVAAGQQYARDAAGNIIGAGTAGANFGFDAARTAGGFGTEAARTAGQFDTAAAGQAGQFTLSSVGQAGGFTTNAANTAIRQDIEGADARAAGTLNSANAWANTAGSLGTIGTEVWNNRPRSLSTMGDPLARRTSSRRDGGVYYNAA